MEIDKLLTTTEALKKANDELEKVERIESMLRTFIHSERQDTHAHAHQLFYDREELAHIVQMTQTPGFNKAIIVPYWKTYSMWTSILRTNVARLTEALSEIADEVAEFAANETTRHTPPTE